jgi:ABC-type glycerol-3-phosphate transport system substrate-binding protein
MKRIIGSLFAIVAIVGAGVIATGAYFTTTDTASNYTFTAGSAGLVFAPCGTGSQVNIDCSSVTPTLTTYPFVTSQATGPGLAAAGCMVVENTGPYLLHLTANEVVTGATPDGMQDAFQVYSQLTNSGCADPSGLGMIYSWQSARSAASAGNVAVTDLAPGAKIFILLKNRWDSTGNQNALQGGTLHITTSLTGTTD